MNNEIEIIAKKYRLNGDKTGRVIYNSSGKVNLSSTDSKTYLDKIRALEFENERLKNKYSEVLEKNKLLNKELDRLKNSECNLNDINKTSSEEIQKKIKKVSEYEEKIKFYEGEIDFLIEDNSKYCSILLQKIEYLNLKLDYYQSSQDLEKIRHMKELLSMQKQENELLKNDRAIYESTIEKLKEDILTNKTYVDEEIKRLRDLADEAYSRYENESKLNSKLLNENNYLKAKCKNVDYELELEKKKQKRSNSFLKLLT
jgi:chromosome segregation ATPase